MGIPYPALAGGVALTAAAAGAAWFLERDIAVAAIAGVAAAGVGATIFEAMSRMGDVKGLKQELQTLRKQQSKLQHDISVAKDGMIAVHHALQEGGGAQKQRMAAMEDEVAVLQKLFARLQEASANSSSKAPVMEKVERKAAGMSPAQVLDLVRQAVAEGAVDLYLQPVVSLPQRRRRYFECLSRIPDGRGGVLAADAYVAAAEEAGLLAPIDNLLLFRAVQLVRRARSQNAHIGFFCNVSRHTLKDRGFLADFANFMEENADLAPSLILEIAQADWDPADQAIQEDMEMLAELGVRYSLDRVSDLEADVGVLRRRGFKFLKADAKLLMQPDAPDPLRFKRRLEDAGIKLIAERIERERDLVELLEHDIDLGQGYLFGEPRAPQIAPVAGAAAA